MALAKRKLRPVKAEEALPAAAELEKLYHDMLLIRRFEEKAGQMYGMGLIGGFCHLYIGEEAVVVGVLSAVEPGDSIITSYRDHGHMLASGMDPKGVMAELTGRSGGYSKGKGGSMHMFSLEKHFYGGHGIVGAQVPIGTGLAFAHKYRNDGGIAVTFLGDGAMNQGQVAESFNMAELWKLPVLYVIENNKYGMGTSVARSSSSKDLYTRGEAFNIPGGQADGMSVLAVKAAAERAIHDIRAGKGPYLLELLTYRYRGHSMSDPAKYRSKDELNRMRQEHDPIDQMKRTLIEAGVADEARLKEVDRRVKETITAASEYAQESPEPAPEELYADVYVEA
jgi:pyruvate dehydrogenase E1 component subunit alpha